MGKRDRYPIAVVEDRYGGVYSGGACLAVARSNQLENDAYRIVRSLEDGPHGDDGDAALVWSDPPDWIAAGHTPDEAIRSLQEKQAS